MNRSFFDNAMINEKIKIILEKNLQCYKKIKYAYAIMSKNNPARFVVISNRKNWFEIYINNSFQFIDPVLITALNRLTPFSWDEHVVLSHGIDFFNIASRYNITSGYTFVLHDYDNNLAVLSLIIDDECEFSIEKIIQTDRGNVQMVLNTIHEKLLILYHNIMPPNENYDEKPEKYFHFERMRLSTGPA